MFRLVSNILFSIGMDQIGDMLMILALVIKPNHHILHSIIIRNKIINTILIHIILQHSILNPHILDIRPTERNMLKHTWFLMFPIHQTTVSDSTGTLAFRKYL